MSAAIDDREDRVIAGVRALGARFAATTSAADHLRIVDEAAVRKQIAWLRSNWKDQWLDLQETIKASWDRHYGAQRAALVARSRASGAELFAVWQARQLEAQRRKQTKEPTQ